MKLKFSELKLPSPESNLPSKAKLLNVTSIKNRSLNLHKFDQDQGERNYTKVLTKQPKSIQALNLCVFATLFGQDLIVNLGVQQNWRHPVQIKMPTKWHVYSPGF